MNYTIKNSNLLVEFRTKGAEITKIEYNNISYLHDANPLYWGYSAPLLWPNIGAIKDGYSLFDNNKYPMKKHGIARTSEFEVIEHKDESITFVLNSNDETKTIYPFDFSLIIKYQLDNNMIKCSIKTINKSTKVMPFNLGLHPAFKVPLLNDETFEDYFFSFDKSGTYEMPYVNLNDGTIDFNKRIRTFTNLSVLPLNYRDYDNDALIFENILSHKITLQSKVHNHGVTVEFNDFPHLGIWTPFTTKAPFICIEPWIGCGDTPNTNHEFIEKRDIINVNPNEEKVIEYSFTIF